MMRFISISIGMAAGLALFTSISLAQPPADVNLTGSWLFTWQNDARNTNFATLNHAGGTITGSYTNDAKENCPLVGRTSASGTTLLLTISCPRWEIRTEGSIESRQLITGKYRAYGSAVGDFRMARQ